MITKKEFLELTQMQNSPAVSVFIPTHRAGKETLNGEDALKLKNQLKEVKHKLEKMNFHKNEIKKFTTPITNLINDGEFWRHQSDGLAVFLSDNRFKTYTVPVHFEESNTVSNDFYLKPLMPLFNGDGRFYLLTLKADAVSFYEGSRHSITEIEVDDLTPSRLEDVVGYDFEQKSLQFRTQQGNQGEGTFHGHAKSDEKAKNELLQYFRAIDKGLMKILHNDQAPPLVVACLDYHFPIYKEANSYQNLYAQHISGNPADMDSLELHERAWALLESHFNRKRQDKKALYQELSKSGKTSSDLNEILTAAQLGKVDTLFIEKNGDILGQYNYETGLLTAESKTNSTGIPLLNFAAVKVFEQGGKVFLENKEDLPDSTSKINAVYRY
jgi:hypothetical protein